MEYKEEFLQNCSIYQLRMIAHQVGVKAPTSKKKEELINHILAIQNGDEASYFPQIRMGRPVKDVLNKPFGSIRCLTSSFNSSLVFNDSQFEGKAPQTSYVKGYLVETQENDFYIVRYDNPVAVECIAWTPSKFVNKKNVRSGNYVKAEVLVRNQNELPIVTNFVEVEGQTTKNSNVEQFENKKVCFDKSRYFSCANGTVFYGDRVLFCGEKFKILKNVLGNLTNIHNYCESIVLLALNLTPDIVNKLNEYKNIELFFSLFSDNYDTQFFTYKLAVDHSKRLAELGKRVIFVVFDLDHLYDNLNMNESDKCESIKNLYGLSRNFEDAGSFTVITTCSNEFYESNAYLKNFLDVAFVEIDSNVLNAENLRSLRDSL